MTGIQRIKDILFGVLLLIIAASVIAVPEEGYYIIALVIGGLLLLYGVRLLWFYVTMSRFMVGGRSILVKAILVLDLGLFTFMIAGMKSVVIIIFLLGVYAISGVIDVLRAMEIKKNGGTGWKGKLIEGAVIVLLALILIVLAVFKGQSDYLVYGFGIGLVYSAVLKILDAFRKNTLIFIP